jgi:hypothetical protein
MVSSNYSNAKPISPEASQPLEKFCNETIQSINRTQAMTPLEKPDTSIYNEVVAEPWDNNSHEDIVIQ